MTASPAATPEKPHRVPVPEVARALGDHGDVGADHPARGEQPGVHGHRLQVPAERLPAVTHAASHPASRSPATVRENQAGSAPPSVIT